MLCASAWPMAATCLSRTGAGSTRGALQEVKGCLWEHDSSSWGTLQGLGCFARETTTTGHCPTPAVTCVFQIYYEISLCQGWFVFRNEFSLSSGAAHIPVFPCQFLWLHNPSPLFLPVIFLYPTVMQRTHARKDGNYNNSEHLGNFNLSNADR